MTSRKKKKETLVFDRTYAIDCITDIFLDAMAHSTRLPQEHADFISTEEIMRFLGVPENDLYMIENTEYDLRVLRKKLKTKESCVIFDAVETKYHNEAGVA